MPQNDLNQIMQQQIRQAFARPVYCRYCGKNVKEPTSNSTGGSQGDWRKHLDWEIENHAHVVCAKAAMRK